MKIVILGPQGSGKSTVGEMLAEHFKLPFISLGQVFRDIPESNPYFTSIKACLESGELVPLHIAAPLVRTRLEQSDCANGYVLDGWCRRILDVTTYNPDPDIVLVIDISRETSIKRISGRRTCTSDGKIYNIYTLPKEILAECKGELVQREDDTEEVVKTRLEIYYSQTQEVIDYFIAQEKAKIIDGEGTPQEVFDLALKAVDTVNTK